MIPQIESQFKGHFLGDGSTLTTEPQRTQEREQRASKIGVLCAYSKNAPAPVSGALALSSLVVHQVHHNPVARRILYLTVSLGE
jgi:hypothetical protein